MINQIEFSLPSEYFNSYRNNNGRLEKLTPLAAINFFVGANNNGKSRFLRGLARELFHYESPIDRGRGVFGATEFHIGLLDIKRSEILKGIRPYLEQIGEKLDGSDGKRYYKKIMPEKSHYNEHDLAAISTISMLE